MLVLRKAVKMLWNLPEAAIISYASLFGMLMWMILWSFGISGVVASNMGSDGRWWLVVVRNQFLLENLLGEDKRSIILRVSTEEKGKI